MTTLTLVPANASLPAASKAFDVKPSLTVVLGREASCDIRVEESLDMVSRRHLTIRWDGETLAAHDSSSNGSFVNGQRVVKSQPIHDEDTIQLGNNGPIFTVALDPKPLKAPPLAKATRLYASPPATAPALFEPLASGSAAPSAPKPGPMDSTDDYLIRAQGAAEEAHSWLTQVFTHAVVFIGVYLFFMLLTYYLPYVGSNSSTVTAFHAMAGSVNKALWAHLLSLGVLIAITWYRGSVIGKTWIMIFPIIATMFDLLPVLSWIPLIPTFMHIAAMIMGVRGRTTN